MVDQKPLLNSPRRGQINSEEIMGGPEFETAPGWGHKVNQWLKKYFSRVILPGIAIVILIIGITNYMENKSDREVFNLDNIGTTGFVKLEEETGGVLQELVKDDEGEIVELVQVAEPGDGVTHLARKALKKYLELDSELELLPEQKIYIEDYLKDMIGSDPLEIGDTIKFSVTDINAAIGAALLLNDAQIENLSKYVPLVIF